MSNKLGWLGEDRRVRLLGALAGLAPGLAAMLVIGRGDSPDWSTAVATAILGTTLGWAFATRAARPGWQNGLHAIVAVTLWAVVLGSFLVVALATDYSTIHPSEWIAAVVVVALLGLVFVGIPMGLLIFVIATGWVGVVKASVHLGFVALTPAGV